MGRNISGDSISLKIDIDIFNLKKDKTIEYGIEENKNPFAFITSIYLSYYFATYNINWDDKPLFKLYLNDGIGGAIFTNEDIIVDKIGNETYTELGNKNKIILYSYFKSIGINLLSFEHFAFDYSFEVVSVEKETSILNTLLVSSIWGLAQYLDIGSLFFPITSGFIINWDNVAKRNTFNFFWKLTFSVLETIIDFNYHNWPFNDPLPLKYIKNNLCIIIR